MSWGAQPRGDRGIAFGEAFARHGVHVLIGLVWGAIVLAVSPFYFLWLLPVVLGLVSSMGFTMWTSRADAGQRARTLGLFMTPEETSPPPELLSRAAVLERPVDVVTATELVGHLPEPAPRGMRPQLLKHRPLRTPRFAHGGVEVAVGEREAT